MATINPNGECFPLTKLSDIIRLYGDLELDCFYLDYSPADCSRNYKIEGRFLPKVKMADFASNKGDETIMRSWTTNTIDDSMTHTSSNYVNWLADIDTGGTDYSNYFKSNQSTVNDISENLKGENDMDIFNGMFGKVANGTCRLGMNGGIAVKTSNGYKTYNVKTGRLVNCSNFVFNVGEEFFFVIPTNKVEPGDIILISGKPKCVIKSDGNTITVINYEDSTVETILPERHVFMGNAYFYGKIVSMFGDDILKDSSGKGTQKLMKYMLLSEMMKGMNSNNRDGMNSMLPLLLMNGSGFDGLFGDIFNFDDLTVDDCGDIEDGAIPE